MKQFFFVFFLLSFSLFTRTDAQPTILPGVKAGLNLSGFVSTYGGGSEVLYKGPQIGGYLQFWLSENDEGLPRFTIQPELVYTAAGEQTSDGDKLVVNYLSLPITIQRYLGSTGIALETGLQPGYLLSSKEIVSGVSMSNKEYMNEFSLWSNFGVQYSHTSGIGLNARLSRALTSAFKDDVYRNVSITFTLSYSFGSGDSSYY